MIFFCRIAASSNSEPIPKDVKLDDSISTYSGYIINEERMLQDSVALKSLQKNINKNELLYKATKATHYGSIDAVASYAQQRTLNAYDSTPRTPFKGEVQGIFSLSQSLSAYLSLHLNDHYKEERKIWIPCIRKTGTAWI